MNVAQVRGIKFEQDAGGVWNPTNKEKALRVLHEVATVLGYPDIAMYNNACVYRPTEVESRLKALR